MSAVIVGSPFNACGPPVELLDWPLWFPPPNYRGSPEPIDENLSPEEAAARAAAEEAARQQAARVPPPNKQREKFEELAGGKKVVDVATAGRIARELRFAPSQGDMLALQRQTNNEVSFEQYQEWMTSRCAPHRATDTPSRLMSVFRGADPQGTGKVTREQFVWLLSQYGEALSLEEVEAFLQSQGITGGTVDYEQIVQQLLAED